MYWNIWAAALTHKKHPHTPGRERTSALCSASMLVRISNRVFSIRTAVFSYPNPKRPLVVSHPSLRGPGNTSSEPWSCPLRSRTTDLGYVHWKRHQLWIGLLVLRLVDLSDGNRLVRFAFGAPQQIRWCRYLFLRLPASRHSQRYGRLTVGWLVIARWLCSEILSWSVDKGLASVRGKAVVLPLTTQLSLTSNELIAVLRAHLWLADLRV